MDPAAPVVKMQLPGPERDGPAVVLGPDLLGQWVANIYFDFAYGSQIDMLRRRLHPSLHLLTDHGDDHHMLRSPAIATCVARRV